MESFSLGVEQLAGIVKGKAEGVMPIPVDHVIIDSRKISFPKSAIFFAIVGQRHNGHHFLKEAYKQGVRCFVVSEDVDTEKLKKAAFVYVDDPLQALQRLASWSRNRFDIPVIGVTGSNGKTIVKEWLYQLLEEDHFICRSPKSYNSQVGVPLSILQLHEKHEMGVFEAGISQAGEMSKLEKMIRPTIGVFTNIGHAHDEGFLNVRQKVNEKLSLFARSNLIVYCSDQIEVNSCIQEMKSKLGREDLNLFSWGTAAGADMIVSEVETDSVNQKLEVQYKLELANEQFLVRIPFKDLASIENALHCIAIMVKMGKSPEVIQERILELQHVAMRLELKQAINNCSLINDSYNSDIESLEIALDFIRIQDGHNKKTLILSDMLQSGLDDSKLYKEIADLVNEKEVDRIIGIGPAISKQASMFESQARLRTQFFQSTEECINVIRDLGFENESILLKGARSFHFEDIADKLEKKLHHTRLEINLNALLHNINVYHTKLKKGTKLMAMVKAFSYGSGGAEIANALQFTGVDYLAVAYADEGVALRKAGITLPIMVMNTEERSFLALHQYDLEPEIYSLFQLQNLLHFLEQHDKSEIKIHIKLDTGMHRLGFVQEEVKTLAGILEANSLLNLASIFTHLSGSDSKEFDKFTSKQFNLFTQMADEIEANRPSKAMRHILNSAGIVRFPDYQLDMVRLGIGMYGIDPSTIISDELKLVSTLKSQVSQIKKVKKGETIGYGRKGVALEALTIATVGIGYADGIDRRLGNGAGKMLIGNQFAFTIGNVCMDMCMLDITDLDVREGDEVIVFGEKYSVEEMAATVGTIPYELLTGISERVERVYYQE